MLLDTTGGYLSPRTISEELDVSPRQVRIWIAKGELPVVHIEHLERIPVEEYRAFLRRKIGEP